MSDDTAPQTTSNSQTDSTVDESSNKQESPQEINFRKLKEIKDSKIKELEEQLATERAKAAEREAKDLEEQGKYKELAEIEKQKRADTESKLYEEKVNNQLANQLAKSNINPELTELITTKAKELAKVDENGNLIEVKGLIEDLKNQFPSAFKSTVKPLNSTPTTPSKKTSALTPNGINQMSFAEYVEARKNQG